VVVAVVDVDVAVDVAECGNPVVLSYHLCSIA